MQAGFGQKPSEDREQMIAANFTSYWGAPVKALEDKLDVVLEDMRFRFETALAHEYFDLPSLHIPVDTVAGHRFAVEGIVNGRPTLIIEHVIRLHDDVAPHWPKLASGVYG